MKSLDGKVAFVTGGANRGGRAFVLTLAEAGADIVFTYWHTAAEAEETKADIEALGRRCLMAEIDIRDIEAMAKFVDQIEKFYGRLDILVHNAANYNEAPFLEVTYEHWCSSMDTILTGPFFLSQAAIKLMLKNDGGRIISLIGNSYYEIWPENIPHTIAKCGLAKLTESLAVSFSPKIQCFCICPASFIKSATSVDTNIIENRGERLSEDGKTYIVNGVHIHKGNAEEVSELLLFLCTCSNYMNGAIIPIDGGKQLL